MNNFEIFLFLNVCHFSNLHTLLINVCVRLWEEVIKPMRTFIDFKLRHIGYKSHDFFEMEEK